MRSCGILLPIASLPSKFGIGCFSKEARDFVDRLNRAGQKLWQILPLGPTGYGNSPYQSFSTYAGSSLYIDLQTLMEEGLLTYDECNRYFYGSNPMYVDYDLVQESRDALLRLAFQRFVPNDAYGEFVRENGFWLEDYALYTAVKQDRGGTAWTDWETDVRDRHPGALQAERTKLKEELAYQRFLQFKFYEQWDKLKAYANDRGIQIIGDMPIYVSFDSSDAWANPLLFQFNEKNEPTAVAGCPPDYFAPKGQLWGNPLYSWEYHRETGYAWWISRMQHSLELYDIVRIDHFRGFDEYYSVPYGDETAEFGHWEKGPGIELFRTLQEHVKDLTVIAEDLGFLTETVIQLVKDTGYPGMKVLEFAFDGDPNCLYLPHNVPVNSIMYTGTHDNDTLLGWIRTLPDYAERYARKYLNYYGNNERDFVWAVIRAALSSVSERTVIPMQDYLCLGSEARINTPSTVGDNWKWRLLEGQFTDQLADQIRDIASVYGRV